jgi:hypothetical protein
MLRKLITVSALAAGVTTAAVMLAAPALAKGPSRATITGPGLGRAIIVSGNGEPGLPGRLSTLALQTRLFIVMFGANASVPAQPLPRLRTPPPQRSLGPRYTVIYTVPGIAPQPGQQYGRISQDLYPRAAGGPVVYTPARQAGFGGPLQVTGWLRASPGLTRTLAKLGVPSRVPATRHTRLSRAARAAAAPPAGSPGLAWLIAAAAALAVAALAGTALWLRRRKRSAAIAR